MSDAMPASISAMPPQCVDLASDDDGATWHVTWAAAGETGYTEKPEAVAVQGEMRVLYRDSAIIVVDKPAFFPTENTRTIRDSVRSRVEALLRSDGDCRDQGCTEPPPVHIPHRLDWETSGLLVVALGSASMRSLSQQFASRSVHKVYVADVLGAPPASCGMIDLPLAPDPDRRPRQRVDFRAGKAARTNWQVERTAHAISVVADPLGRPHACRLRLAPESGRRHQLRMHCMALGCVIAGDGLYERSTCAGDTTPTRLHLHAAEITFVHPTEGRPITFVSQPPFALERAAERGMERNRIIECSCASAAGAPYCV